MKDWYEIRGYGEVLVRREALEDIYRWWWGYVDDLRYTLHHVQNQDEYPGDINPPY